MLTGAATQNRPIGLATRAAVAQTLQFFTNRSAVASFGLILSFGGFKIILKFETRRKLQHRNSRPAVGGFFGPRCSRHAKKKGGVEVVSMARQTGNYLISGRHTVCDTAQQSSVLALWRRVIVAQEELINERLVCNIAPN